VLKRDPLGRKTVAPSILTATQNKKKALPVRPAHRTQHGWWWWGVRGNGECQWCQKQKDQKKKEVTAAVRVGINKGNGGAKWVLNGILFFENVWGRTLASRKTMVKKKMHHWSWQDVDCQGILWQYPYFKKMEGMVKKEQKNGITSIQMGVKKPVVERQKKWSNRTL